MALHAHVNARLPTSGEDIIVHRQGYALLEHLLQIVSDGFGFARTVCERSGERAQAEERVPPHGALWQVKALRSSTQAARHVAVDTHQAFGPRFAFGPFEVGLLERYALRAPDV